MCLYLQQGFHGECLKSPVVSTQRVTGRNAEWIREAARCKLKLAWPLSPLNQEKKSCIITPGWNMFVPEKPVGQHVQS